MRKERNIRKQKDVRREIVKAVVIIASLLVSSVAYADNFMGTSITQGDPANSGEGTQIAGVTSGDMTQQLNSGNTQIYSGTGKGVYFVNSNTPNDWNITAASPGVSMAVTAAQTTINSTSTAIAGTLTIGGETAATQDWVLANIPTPDLSGYAELAGASFSGAVSATSLSSSGGVAAGGAITGVTTIGMGGALTGATTISASGQISSSSSISGVGLTSTGGLSNSGGSFNNNSQGITNAGAISGATTINASGAVTAGSVVTETIGTTTATSDLSISAGSTSGNINLNAKTATTINVNQDGLGANESFTVKVGGAAGVDAPVTITTIQSNENSTVISNSAATFTVGGASQANAITLSSGNNTVIGTTNINSTGGATTNIATTTAAITNIGVTGGTNNLVGTTNVTGTTNINTTGVAATNIGNSNNGTVATITGGASSIQVDNTSATMSNGSNSIDVSAAANTVLGTTNINVFSNSATNINTGTSTSAVTIGNSANTTNVNSATNNIGVNTFATANNIGTNSAAASTNTIGSTNAGTTVTALGGNSTMSVANNTASMGVTAGSTITATDNQVTALTASGQGLTVNNNGTVSLLNGVADTGNALSGHGLNITNTQTTLSGGTNSSTLTLQDSIASLAVGTAATHEIQVLNATNTAGETSVTIGGINNVSNQLMATGAAGTNNIQATATNTITAGTNNVLSATLQNQLTGGTGNAITATTGNNAISATAGSNTIFANAANQSNTLSATGVNGVNNITANATTGITNIEAKFNNIGVATAASINSIGNINAATTVSSYGGAGYNTLNNATSTMGTGTGGTVQTTATTATVRASSSGTLATNGTTGTMTVGAGGGYMAYNSSQNSGVGTTVGGVVDNKSYTNKINGNLFVDGNVYINGTLDYVSSNSANTTVVGLGSGTSILPDPTNSTSAGTAIVLKGSDGTQTVVDANGKLTNVNGVATESTASLTLTNGLGNVHGIVVTETKSVLSGGIHSSSLTMDDNGATFSDVSTGQPVQVHGVNDGTADFDAVNVRQMAAGVAMAAGLAALPQVEPGKTFALTAGSGMYMHQASLAFGVSGRFLKDFVVKGGVAFTPSYTKSHATGNIGIAYSF